MESRERVILVAVEDAATLLHLKNLLARSGHRVLAAGSVEEAVEQCASGAAGLDLVVWDLTTRTALADRLHAMYANVPALLWSGETGNEWMHKVRRALNRPAGELA